MPKSNAEWDEVARELRRISRILAMIAIKDEESQRKQIMLLSEMGFLPSEIATMVGTTPITVSVALQKIRRETRQKPSSGKKATAKL